MVHFRIRKAASAIDRLCKDVIPEKKKPPKGTLRLKSKKTDHVDTEAASSFNYLLQRTDRLKRKETQSRRHRVTRNTFSPNAVLVGLGADPVNLPQKPTTSRYIDESNIALILIYFSEAGVCNERLADVLCKRAEAIPTSSWTISLALSVIKALGIINKEHHINENYLSVSRLLLSSVKDNWKRDQIASKFGVSVWLAATYMTPEDVSQLVSFFVTNMGDHGLKLLSLSCALRYLSAASLLINEHRCPENVVDLAVDLVGGDKFILPRSPGPDISSIIVWASVVIMYPFVDSVYSYSQKDINFADRLRQVFDHYALIKSPLGLTNTTRVLWSFNVAGERLPNFVKTALSEGIERELSKQNESDFHPKSHSDTHRNVSQLLTTISDMKLSPKSFPAFPLLVCNCNDIVLLSKLHSRVPDNILYCERVAELICLQKDDTLQEVPSKSLPQVLQCCISFINSHKSGTGNDSPAAKQLATVVEWCRLRLGDVTKWAGDCNDQSLFLLVWCAASLRHTNQSDIKMLVTQIVNSNKVTISSREITSVALSHRQLSVSKYSELIKLCSRLSDPSIQFHQSDIASSLWSFTRLKLSDPLLYDRISNEAKKYSKNLSKEEQRSIENDFKTIRRQALTS